MEDANLVFGILIQDILKF